MNRFNVIVRIILLLAMFSSTIFLSGCDAGSNSPISTGLSAGSGYKIQLGSSLSSLKPGGTSALTAVVFEPDGSPIRDGESVVFTSSEKGSFAEDTVKTTGGTAVVVYTAGNYSYRFDTLTATCHGATANLQILISSENF